MRRRKSYYRQSYYGFGPYVSVAERQRAAEREVERLKKKGQVVSPVVIEGHAIARTFWGGAWCTNLERYSDFSNRLPRGRSYVRNGAVVDLQIAPGEVTAMVSGSAIYRVAVKVSAVPKARWSSICRDCAGAIESLVELLQGHLSKGVMERICQQTTGLFPAPAEIEFSCSCPDWASMCKHVAAVFYGIGARLDEHPELLFKLRKVDEKDLIAKAGKGLPLSKSAPAEGRLLAADDLSTLFGLDMGASTDEPMSKAVAPAKKAARARRPAKPYAEPAAKAAPARARRATKPRTEPAASEAPVKARRKAKPRTEPTASEAPMKATVRRSSAAAKGKAPAKREAPAARTSRKRPAKRVA